MLRGFIAFFKDYANVYFIDLPGFSGNTPPLPKITLSAYARFLEKEIAKLKLDRYILVGASFGHRVFSELQPDKKCKAMLSLGPFVTRRSVKLTLPEKISGLFLLNIICSLKLEKVFWHKKLFKIFFHFDQAILDTLFKDVDPVTFFTTARLVLGCRQEKWLTLPHVLASGKHDDRISYEENYRYFKHNVKDLLIIHPHITQHFSGNKSKEYFQKCISSKEINKIFSFLDPFYSN